MQIVFTADVNTGSFRYEAQQSYDLDKPIADRFIAQGVARLPFSTEGEGGSLQGLVSGTGNRTNIPIPDAQLASNWAQYGTVNGTFTNSTDSVLGQVLNINVTTVGTRQMVKRKLGVQVDKFAGLSFWLKRDANCTVIDMEITVGDYASNRRMVHNKAVSALGVGEWVRVVVPMSEYENTAASPTTADVNFITSIAIGATAAGGQTTTLQVAGMMAHDCGSGGTVSIQFDDARTDTYTDAFPIMRSLGLLGAVAPEYHRLGTVPSYSLMTLANVSEIYAAGWDVLGHHVSNMPGLSEAAQTAIYEANRDWMRTNGFSRGEHIWVWPGGQRDAISEQYARRHWQVTRRVGAFAYTGIPGIFDPTSPQNFYVTNSQTAASLLAVADKVKAYGGNIVFVFHSIVNSKVAAEDFLISDFLLFCQGLVARSIPVLPVSKVWTKT